MSDTIDRFRWERGLRDERISLKAATVGLLYALSAFFDAKTGAGFASQPQLARAARMSERTVRRHLELAIDAGVLERVARGHRVGDGTAIASTYKAALPADVANTIPPTDFSTGHKRHVEKSQPVNQRAQPVNQRASTGHTCPPLIVNPSPQGAPMRLPTEHERQIAAREFAAARARLRNPETSATEDTDPTSEPAIDALTRDLGAVFVGDERTA